MKRKEMVEFAKRMGLQVRLSKPGDGVRYRFFDLDAETSYDGPAKPHGTAVGLHDAVVWLRGFESGYVTAVTRQVGEEVRR
jgi:hypothetical protein